MLNTPHSNENKNASPIRTDERAAVFLTTQNTMANFSNIVQPRKIINGGKNI